MLFIINTDANYMCLCNKAVITQLHKIMDKKKSWYYISYSIYIGSAIIIIHKLIIIIIIRMQELNCVVTHYDGHSYLSTVSPPDLRWRGCCL